MKIAVIVADFGAALHMGGEVERTFRQFDLPPEIAQFIESARINTHATVSLALEPDEPQGETTQRAPLTNEQIIDGFDTANTPGWSLPDRAWFAVGAQWAEQQHGIGITATEPKGEQL